MVDWDNFSLQNETPTRKQGRKREREKKREKGKGREGIREGKTAFGGRRKVGEATVVTVEIVGFPI